MTEALRRLPASDRHLGQTLMALGVVSRDQLRIAAIERARSDLDLGQVLSRLGFVSESLLRDTQARALGHDSVDLARIVPDPDALRLLPAQAARKLGVFPIALDREQRRLQVAVPAPFDPSLLDRLHRELGGDWLAKPLLSSATAIADATDRNYGVDLTLDRLLAEMEAAPERGGEHRVQPVVRLLDAMLSDAVRQGASDIHIEPESGYLRLRYRIDGVLRQVLSLHSSYASPLTVRTKVLAGMDIAESRMPQDGRFRLSVAGRSCDFRVSTLPTTHGENIVLRVLDHDRRQVSLAQLGLDQASLERLAEMTATPQGMLLVTGPTGSGKTTTLYALLDRLSSESVNIMTLEDPVEYELPLVRQTNAGESGRLGFARGIRHLMRQDPDIILVGEIRDEETATMALRAAMTGHQVFSTLHTTSAAGAVARLIDTGIQPQLLAGNLIGIVGQRLVRKLCPNCRRAQAPDPRQRRHLQRLLGDADWSQTPLYAGRGCECCGHTGYSGRLAVMECLLLDADFDILIARGAATPEIQRLAAEKGLDDLPTRGARLLLDGVTSIQELERSVGLGRDLASGTS